jgi:hypothetical protein
VGSITDEVIGFFNLPNPSSRTMALESTQFLTGIFLEGEGRSERNGGQTPTALRQASRHETKETKADVSIMTQTGVRRFS